MAGGASTGHIAPLIATAEQILAVPGSEVTCIGTARGLETRVIPEAGLALELIDPVPIPRRLTADLVRVPPRLRRAVGQATAILRDAQAQVLVGFGGYVAAPAYLAARRLGVPVVLHEQNAVPGLANRLAARFARVVAVTFPATQLPRAQFIGLPVRSAITSLATEGRASQQDAARLEFGLRSDLATLLVSGGSQGARSLNQAVLSARERLLATGVQILHVWGPKNLPADAVTQIDADTGARYVPVGYVDEMTRAYAAADLMLGRAGAGTVVETAIVGLPAIVVPLPHGNGEQARNAADLVAAGGAVLVPDSDLTGERLLSEVARIHDPGELSRMAEIGQRLMRPDAAAVLAALVHSVAQGGRDGDQ